MSVNIDRLPLVKTAARMFRQHCYSKKNKISAGIICAGWDEVNGGSVYSVPLGGACIRQPFAIGGSGSTYIYGLCDAEFKPDMSKEECRTFVKKCIAHAMARDGSSGGVIRTVVLDKDGVDRDYTPGDQLPFMGLDGL